MSEFINTPHSSPPSADSGTENRHSASIRSRAQATQGGKKSAQGGAGATDHESLWRDWPDAPVDAEFEKLRSLLFARELAVLERIKAQLGGRNVKQVSDVLAEAVAMRGAQDKALGAALEPVVDDIIKTSLRRHQNEFVSVLFPLMGPSIRKSIAETFRSMLGSFSKSMEMAFSWRGLKWRFEAIRSGKSFGETVMLHTLVYRVEQIFFIHSETGIVLSHLSGEGADAQDADMVSAMLTAIQDFARDCFAAGTEGELESMRLGEFTIFIEKSAEAYVACVVRGTPPADFGGQMRGLLEVLQIKYGEALESFNGDITPFIDSPQYLDECMISRYADDEGKLPIWAKLLPVVLALILAGGVLFSHYREQRLLEIKEAALGVLRSEPGLMLMSVSDNIDPPWDVFALQDNLATRPESLLVTNGMDAGRFSFKTVPFISYDPVVVDQRARITLGTLPDTVRMVYDGRGGLIFSGTAPMQWMLQTYENAKSIPGITRVDMRRLDDPMMDRILELIKEVEDVSIEFAHDKDTPVPADLPKLEQVVNKLVLLENLTGPMDLSMSLTIYGHADLTGKEQRNYEISRQRAAVVAAMLYDRGSSMPVSIYGFGSQYPKEPGMAKTPGKTKDANQASRRIELRVHLNRAATSIMDMLRE